ncbi:head GIN domain-containing protein [Chitinophagaceae bacterium LWZ2-11]
MKQTFLLLLTFISLHSFAQWQKIDGNGNVVKEKRQASGYTEISSSGSMDVMVAYGNSNDIEIEAEDNLLPYIVTEVSGNRLIIKTKNVNFRSHKKITVYVSLTKLEAVRLSGSGNIIGRGKFENDGTTDVSLSGSGNITFSFNTIKSLDISISGSGNVKLDGSASTVKASISGSGNADCSNVICDDVSARVNGSGNVRVFANKSLDASISGSGGVYYKGAATDVRKRTAGSGRVVKM